MKVDFSKVSDLELWWMKVSLIPPVLCCSTSLVPKRIPTATAKNEVHHRNVAPEHWSKRRRWVTHFATRIRLKLMWFIILVCISILHEPGDDKWGYEQASERWLPVHTVETIIISVISMLAEPNDESPANVDAAKQWREAYPEFKRRVARCVRKSQEE